jgi:hypothetical protein
LPKTISTLPSQTSSGQPEGALVADVGTNADDIRAGAVKGLDSRTAILHRHDPSAQVSEFIDRGLGLDYPATT